MKKQAAETPSDTFSIGKAFNTMLNPLAGVTGGGEWWVPKTPKLTTDPVFDNTLKHALAVGGTYGGLALLTRYIVGKAEEKKDAEARESLLKSRLETSAPMVTPDPDVADKEYVPKEASVVDDIFRKLNVLEWTGLESGSKSIGNSPMTPYKLALPILMAAGATAGGYGLADKYLNRQEGEEVEKEIAGLKNQLDARNYAKLMKARGHEVPVPEEEEEEPVVKEASLTKEALSESIIALISLLALTTAGTAGYASYNATKSQDPNRLKMKQVKNALSELGKREQATAPTKVAPMSPALVSQLDKHLGPKTKKPEGLPTVQSVDVHPVIADKSDPTMSLI
jgi:hypothetical protein